MPAASGVSKARAESKALFAALKKGNNKLQDSYNSTSEYKEKYIEWPLAGRIKALSNTGKENKDISRFGENESSSNTWTSELGDKFRERTLPAYERSMPITRAQIDSVRIGGMKGEGAEGWGSESHAKYPEYPFDERRLVSKPKADSGEDHVRIGGMKGEGADGWGSEQTAAYTIHDGVYKDSTSRPPLSNSSSLNLGDEIGGTSGWNSESSANFQGKPQTDNADAGHQTTKSTTALEGTPKQYPLPSYAEYQDASQWRSVYEDMRRTLSEGETPPPVAGMHSADRVVTPINYAWTGTDSGHKTEAPQLSEYSSNFHPMQLENDRAVYPTSFESSASKLTFGDEVTGTDTWKSETNLSYTPHALSTPLSGAINYFPSAVKTPLPFYEAYKNASDWLSSYREQSLGLRASAPPACPRLQYKQLEGGSNRTTESSQNEVSFS